MIKLSVFCLVKIKTHIQASSTIDLKYFNKIIYELFYMKFIFTRQVKRAKTVYFKYAQVKYFSNSSKTYTSQDGLIYTFWKNVMLQKV